MFEQFYGNQGVECSGLNMLGPGSGTIRCGLVGVSVALLEEMCHCGHRLCDPHPSSPEASLLFVQSSLEQDVELSALLTLCLPEHCYLGDTG